MFWSSGYKLTIPPENIVKERAIICVSWLVFGQKKVHTLTWDAKQNDRELIAEFIEVLNGCRFSIAHNGDRFDMPWLRSRAMKHGLPMWPKYVTVDTLKAVRRLAYMNSNRLDYLGEFFGLGRKQKVGFDLWRRVLLDNDEASLAEMVRYNKQDVRLLSDVYEKLRQYAPSPDSISGSVLECPHCASSDMRIKDRRLTAAGSERICLQCNGCGQYHTVAGSRYDKAKRDAA